MFFVVVMEEFVAGVFKGGNVTIPKRLRKLFEIDDGDYVRLALVVPLILIPSHVLTSFRVSATCAQLHGFLNCY